MRKGWAGLSMIALLAGCGQAPRGNEQAAAAAQTAPTAPISDAVLKAPATGTTSLVRLDCGTIKVDDFSKRFSDQQIYPHGPKTLTDSCYLITHNGQRLLWDTGLPMALLNKSTPKNGMTATLTQPLVKQLREIGVTPEQVGVIGISHSHFDHTGQAALFPSATLVIGPQDLESVKGKDDPFGPWRGKGKVVSMPGDHDMFGDGDVIALFLPGHTAGHHALLVKLKSGPVLLSGDTYHATEAREKRGVPPFNSSRPQSLASMDRFEAIAKETGAKVVIQHEADDIAKLPAFPAAAQ